MSTVSWSERGQIFEVEDLAPPYMLRPPRHKRAIQGPWAEFPVSVFAHPGDSSYFASHRLPPAPECVLETGFEWRGSAARARSAAARDTAS